MAKSKTTTRSRATVASSAASPRNYCRIARQYAEDIVAGRIVAGKWTRLACERQLRDLDRAKARDFPYVWSEAHANDVCDFIEKLPHVQGTWQTPTITLQAFWIFILAAVFGWRVRGSGARRFSTVLVSVGRKAAKSTITAAVSLYCLTCDGEMGPEIVIGATTGAQAGKVFDPAREMVRRTRALRDAFDVTPWARSISCGINSGKIQPINAKGSTQDGWSPHMAVLDELHAHRDRKLYDVIKSAFGARPNALLWMITTAGSNLAGVGYEQQVLAQKILEGIVPGEHFFAIVYALDESDSPFDENVWVKANPGLGVTPDWETLRNDAAEAKASPGNLAEFKAKRLNLWQGAAQAWLNLTEWDACADKTLSLAEFAGQPVWVGVDLSDCNDLTAVVLLFRKNDFHCVFPFFYVPESLLQTKSGVNTAHYKAWASQNLLNETEGNYIDHGRVEADIRVWCKTFAPMAIVCDHYGSQQMMASLATSGLPAIFLSKNAANWTVPAKELERLVRSKLLRHNGHPTLRWMASNVVASKRIDGSLLTKKESAMSPNKIDGIDATIQALSRAMLQQPKQEVPSYARVMRW